MCGILGHIPASEPNLFKEALDTLQHRGPDGFGIWNDNDGLISMGHRRLSIIDLSEAGKQPMFWQDRYIITFNGEIYNYIELRNDLEKDGYHFHSNSDTEVLLALYAKEGSSCLQKLNGMWAFAIYDKQEKTLFLSRDRMGEKPLFYYQQGERFGFASEMKGLYKFLDFVEADVEVVNTAKLDMFGYEATEYCLIKGIKRFPAGCFGVYKNGQLSIDKYWLPLENLIDVPSSYGKQVEMFRELFIDSCKIRMRSDVPVGTALSGGIDSSATISTMAYVAKNLEGVYSRDWQHAFVASFPGSFLDETEKARAVSDYLKVPATFLNIDPLKDIDKLFHYSYLFEEFYITSPIPFISLYGKIKQDGTTVTLDGHGSDELFGGYSFDIGTKIKDDYPNLFKMKETLQTVANMGESNTKITWGRVLLEANNIKKHKEAAGKPLQSNPKLDHLNNRLFQSSFVNILPTLLRNYDRYSMINGVEIRMPFLDHRIVSFAFSIAGTSKVRNGYSKAIVRDAMKGFFPDDIRLTKNKIGFNSPFTEWMKGPLKEWLLDQMESNDFKHASFIQANEVSRNIKKVMADPHASFADGENVWISLMPFIWEKSLKYAK